MSEQILYGSQKRVMRNSERGRSSPTPSAPHGPRALYQRGSSNRQAQGTESRRYSRPEHLRAGAVHAAAVARGIHIVRLFGAPVLSLRLRLRGPLVVRGGQRGDGGAAAPTGLGKAFPVQTPESQRQRYCGVHAVFPEGGRVRHGDSRLIPRRGDRDHCWRPITKNTTVACHALLSATR